MKHEYQYSMDILTNILSNLMMSYFNDLQFVMADHLTHCKASIHRQFTDFYAIMLIREGAMQLSVDHEPHRVLQGPCVFWHHPDHHYSYRPAKDHWHHLWVTFKGPRAKRMIEQGFMPLSDEHHLSLQHADDHYPLMRHLVKMVKYQLPAGHHRAVHLLEQYLLVSMEADRQHSDNRELQIQRLAEQIRQHPDQHYDFKQSAKQLSMSYSHFRACFKQHTGNPPHDYQLRCRMRYAADQLQHSQRPIKQIALDLGYHDPAQFTKLFKLKIGVSPSRLRDMQG